MQNGQVEVMADDTGSRQLAAYVALRGEEPVVGDAARRQSVRNSEDTIFGIRSLLGMAMKDVEVQRYPFQMRMDGSRLVVGVRSEVSLVEVASLVFGKLKQMAEEYLGKKVNFAVVTVPLRFGKEQRDCMQKAVFEAGFFGVQFVEEEEAVVASLGQNLAWFKPSFVLVFAMGSKYLQLSVVGRYYRRVSALAGIQCRVGGEDFTEGLVAYAKDGFVRKTGLHLEGVALQRLRDACEWAKRNLSYASRSTVQVESMAGGHDLHSDVSRAKFEEIIHNALKKVVPSIEEVLLKARLDASELSTVVFAGGSTRIPKVRAMVTAFLNIEPETLHPDPELLPIRGATMHISKSHAITTPSYISVGCDMARVETLVTQDSPLPLHRSKTFQFHSNIFFICTNPPSAPPNCLHSFTLANLKVAKKSIPKITLTIRISEHGSLQITATCNSKTLHSHTIRPSSLPKPNLNPSKVTYSFSCIRDVFDAIAMGASKIDPQSNDFFRRHEQRLTTQLLAGIPPNDAIATLVRAVKRASQFTPHFHTRFNRILSRLGVRQPKP
ncbi:hypothetical protein DSO57_1030059 [Entomophthora muscae]|uniref:Uncharacterized protein n=1 Tax=Entomophthora muscae TaxID=34485 RepID=A0ACC2RFS5_9FUNG|nr:hypothetical protein DSO57_1030059 [Entomophthora muscae]